MALFQATIRKNACWFNIKCRLKDILGNSSLTNLTTEQSSAYNDMMRDLTKTNTKAISSAANMGFHNLDRLNQGATTLNTIMATLHGNKELSKTLDTEGRAAAVKMMEVKMFILSLVSFMSQAVMSF